MDTSKVAQLLYGILEVIDSGTDDIELLFEQEEGIRDAILELTGTYPETVEEFDFNGDKEFRSE